MDIREICLDEIALEGLDGITIPTLWLRLQNREPKLPVQLTDSIKEYLWNYITQHDSLEFFHATKTRFEPEVFNRFENFHSSSIPASTAPDELETLVDVYSVNPYINSEICVRGACADYDKRVDITDEVLHASVPLHTCISNDAGRRFVIVASQDLREKALLPQGVSPTVFTELNDFAYCILERIGRARWQGEMQSALNRLDFTNKNCHIHYVINNLHKLGFVVKNNHTYKRPDMNNRTFFQILVHLSRFERDCRNFTARSIDAIRDLVKLCPDKTMNLGELRDKLNIDPKAIKSVYQTMEKTGEAMVRNHNPGKKAKSLFEKNLTLLEKPKTEKEEDEDDEISNTFVKDSDIITRPLVLEQPFLQQTYNFMLDNGAKGVTQREVLAFLTGYGRLESRNICKSMCRMKVVNSVLVDKGKQRVQVYIPNNFENFSAKKQEFKIQAKKMKKLIGESTKFIAEKEDLSFIENAMDCSTASEIVSCASENESMLQDSIMEASIHSNSIISMNDSNMSETSNLNFLSEDTNRANRLNQIMNYKAKSSHFTSKKWDAHLTARKIKRQNLILEELRSEKIIEGYTSLQRALGKAEEKDGITSKIDKKTVMRLVDKMHEDGILQHSVIPITYNDKTEDYHFMMSLDCPMELLKSAVDQARFKLLGDQENKAARIEQKRKNKEQKLVKAIPGAKKNGKLSKEYFQPKFKRLRIIHKLLWYLLYGHPKAIKWTPDLGIVDPDQQEIFCDEMTWKRFLPPAPIHFHDNLRWLQLGDVAIILPLSVFTQFDRIQAGIDDIDDWLSDNEKCHTLVRHLPQKMRSELFYKRKYMYSLMSGIEQLAFMGLVTMRRGRSGNNLNMPKENMLIYVHKNVSILDTRSTAKQHVKVEDKEYERITYDLKEYSVIEEFWFKLQDVCVQTRLGFTEFRDEEYELHSDHFCTRELKKWIQNIKDKETLPKDDGEIPGDHRGAGGLDSSMYSYLYRNWRAKTYRGKISRTSGDDAFVVSRRLPSLKVKSLNLRPAKKKASQLEIEDSPIQESTSKTASPKKGAKKAKKDKEVSKSNEKPKKNKDPDLVTVNNVGRNERVKGGRGMKRKKRQEEVKALEVPMKKLKMQMQQRKRAKMLKMGRSRVKYTDQGDLSALKKRNGRIRVNFTQAEDSLLLICHIATTLIKHAYFSDQHLPRKKMISWTVIRDLSQKQLPEAFDKTSYSVGRRTRFIMKNPETRICHDIAVADINADAEFLKSVLPENLDSEMGSQEYTDMYLKFVGFLQKKFKTKPGIFVDELPDSTVKILQQYSPKTVLQKVEDVKKKRHSFNDEVRCDDDISRSVIENMTYIALTMEDRDFSVYQAYRAFEAFSDKLLSEVFTKLQTSGFVCAKSDMVRRLPHGIRSHRLAQAHLFTFRALVPQKVIGEMNECVNQIADIKVQTDATEGQVLTSAFLLSESETEFDIDIPDQIVLPDAPNNQLFENQFLSMIKDSKEDFLKEANEAIENSNEATVPPSSLMAAAACILREDLSEETLSKEDDSNHDRDVESEDGTKLKIAEVLKLYHRHPSYTNWLMLIKSNRFDGSEKKFANLNYAVNSDSVVLSPCGVTIPDTKNMVDKYMQRNVYGNGASDLKSKSQKLMSFLKSVKLDYKNSEASWNFLKQSTENNIVALKCVFDVIDATKQIGISESKICASLSCYENSTVIEAISTLKSKNIIFGVGITDWLYVTYKNVHIWMAKAFPFSGEKSKFQDEITYEIELLKQKEKGSETSKNSDDLPQSAKKEIQNKYEEVNYICRPWHTICGDLSVKNTKMLVLSVYLKIFSSPGITLEKLTSSFTFQPICIIELINILCEIGCIKKHCVTKPGVKRLFGAPSQSKILTYYETTFDGLVLISDWYSNAEILI